MKKVERRRDKRDRKKKEKERITVRDVIGQIERRSKRWRERDTEEIQRERERQRE